MLPHLGKVRTSFEYVKSLATWFLIMLTVSGKDDISSAKYFIQVKIEWNEFWPTLIWTN